MAEEAKMPVVVIDSRLGDRAGFSSTEAKKGDRYVRLSDAEAMLKEARRVALEEAAKLVDQEEDNARQEHYHPGLVGCLESVSAAIRSIDSVKGDGK